ncbi:unnamed protein product [Protopolystoma xenopodis]|uniref:Methionyl/Valyl/Leucyl/Isoleucyl-tRNA synthetase anticodon-binding domain-containing protein n=1 Tax=Protopolystoma xenopodis TaxID=117903 RepID=A0A3S5CJ43_9PLAT|nr:unnamed protein product [Protopolystoma xenopodis]
MGSCRDRYREVSQANMHADLLKFYIETQIILFSPICSHLCEHLWRVVLNRKGSVFDASWPQPTNDVSTRLSLEVLST